MREAIESALTALADGDVEYASSLLEDAITSKVKETAETKANVRAALAAARNEDVDDIRQHLLAALDALKGGDSVEDPVPESTEDDVEEAEWSTVYINDLPDSCFAYIEAGGKKDAGGKTEPRSLRHYPYKDASGKVDMPHLRNALARAAQNPETGSHAMAKLNAAAKSVGMHEAETW